MKLPKVDVKVVNVPMEGGYYGELHIPGDESGRSLARTNIQATVKAAQDAAKVLAKATGFEVSVTHDGYDIYN